jgi:muconolactone D-isomerase
MEKENRILAVLTIDIKNLPDNFQEIVKHEQQLIAEWKEAGFLDHFFLRHTKDGAVFIFKDISHEKSIELMESLPLMQFKIGIEYFSLMQQF